MAEIYAVLGAFTGFASILMFRKIPASWFCDFGEEVTEKHFNPRVTRATAIIAILSLTVLFPCVYLNYGNSLKTLSICIAYLFITLCCFSDIIYRIIPIQLCIIITALSFFSLNSLSTTAFLNFFGGGFILAGAFILLALLGKLAYKTEALGFGDVYFALSLGFFLNTSTSWMVFVLCILISGISFAYLKALKVFDEKYAALGPYIAIAFAIVISAEAQLQKLLQLYLALIIRA